MSQFSNRGSGFRLGGALTPVIKWLLIANIGIFIIDHLFFGARLLYTFALFPLSDPRFQVWQVITYGFLHGGASHLIFNMFALWMFGGELEQAWGRNRFIKFYFFCLLGGALFAFFEGAIVLGASGAIFGILLGYGMMWPNRQILLFFVFPVKVKYFVLGLGIIEFLYLISGTGSNISRWAHLGGMAFGFLYLYQIIRRYRSGTGFSSSSGSPLSPSGWKARYNEKKRREKLARHQELINSRIAMREEVDRLLDKISGQGMKSLTRKEKKFLKQASRELGEVEIDRHSGGGDRGGPGDGPIIH